MEYSVFKMGREERWSPKLVRHGQVYTRKYMHAETRYFFKNILTNEKSPKNITFNYKIINFPTYIC
jgi:hypothetical protein